MSALEPTAARPVRVAISDARAGLSARAPARLPGNALSLLQRGFTMVELVVVIVLVGILAGIGAGRFFDRRGFDADAFAEQTRAMLRYAQKAAIARNTPVFVLFDDKRIALCYDTPRGDCPPVSQVAAPGGGMGNPVSATVCRDQRWYCLELPKDVQVSLSVAMTEFSFDALGRPVASNGSFNGLTMTIASAGETRKVAVNQETGYVQ